MSNKPYHSPTEVATVPDLTGAIQAFQRLARTSYSHSLDSFASLFLAQIADLLREVQSGRMVDETEWLESLEAARLISAISDGGLYVTVTN